MSDQTSKTKLKAPLLYLGIAFTAAISSVLVYVGGQYVYQRVTQSSTATILDNPAKADTKSSVPNGDAGISSLRKTSESFRAVAKKVGPSVVNIKATKGISKKTKMRLPPKGRRGAPQPPQDDEEGMPRDPFFDFFERFGNPFPFQQETPQTSVGSGFIIDKKGYVVTNNHVVEDANEILVRLSSDKAELKAKIIGTDPKTDLAVLKVDGQNNLVTAEFADSDQVEVGDWAIAIGSPFALDQSVTVGVVSAKGRNSTGVTEMGGDLIQTDAAINPGNSGGPLCDVDGRVMGVNTAIYTRSGGYMGIGFAIPSNLVKDISEKLIASGKVTRGWLGVYIQPLDVELAKDLGIKEGVGIHEVLESSPASKAGITAGDVIIEVDGKPVRDVNELQRKIGNFKPGDSVKLKLISYNDKKNRTVTVKIGELPENEKEVEKGAPKDQEPDKLGLIVSPDKKKEGVVVEAIQPGSLAEQMLGLEVGDVIVRLNRQNVTSVAGYKKALGSAKRIYLEIKRKGRTLFFQFVLPE
jgi:serine protease Do